ncbi:MAG: sigma-70 family RNA polymerase sigma factor [Archangium sp.]|nr:sigma-70 family RNA polymerase sigma factor [Archangium sp.]
MAKPGVDVEALYRQYGPAIFRRAAALVRDETEAMDVTQDTFMAFLKMADRLRGDAQPFTVLYQIATNQSFERLRRTARWSKRVTPLPENIDEDAVPPPPAVDASKRIDAAHDLALLTKGEDAEATSAAALYFVDGCTTEEIAQSLGLSRKTVGKLLVQFSERARKRAARLAPGAYE